MPHVTINTHSATNSSLYDHTVQTHQSVTNFEPVTITAQDGMNYEVVDPNTGKAPQDLSIERVGNDLHISTQQSVNSATQPDVVIEDYYLHSEQNLIGYSETNVGTDAYFSYTIDTNSTIDAVGDMAIGEVETVVLGGTPSNTPWWSTVTEAASTAGSGLLYGALGLGVGAALIAATNDDDDSQDNKESSTSSTTDTTAPTASIQVADSSLIVGETTKVTITFSEPVTNFDETDLSVDNGSIKELTSNDGGKTWTATLIPNTDTESLSNVISLANTYTDGAGNAGTTAQSNTYIVDTIRPTLNDISVNYFENQQSNGTDDPILATLRPSDTNDIKGYRFVDADGELVDLVDGKVVSDEGGYYSIDAQGYIRLTEAGGLLVSDASSPATKAANNFESQPNAFHHKVVTIDNNNNQSEAVDISLRVNNVISYVTDSSFTTLLSNKTINTTKGVEEDGDTITSDAAYLTSDGNDKLLFGYNELGKSVEFGLLKNTNIDTAAGDDHVRIYGSIINTGYNSLTSSTIMMGAGKDRLTVYEIECYGYDADSRLTIDTGSEDDELTISREIVIGTNIYSNVTSELIVNLGTGNDEFEAKAINFNIGNISSYIDAGMGNDKVTLEKIYCDSGNNVDYEIDNLINLGEGDDELTIDNISFDINNDYKIINAIDMGADNDVLTLGEINHELYGFNTTSSITTRVELGEGDDALTLGNINHSMDISNGVIDATSQVSIDAGDGMDTLYLGDAAKQVNLTLNVNNSDATINKVETTIIKGFEKILMNGADTLNFNLADLVDIQGDKLYIKGTSSDTVDLGNNGNTDLADFTLDSNGTQTVGGIVYNVYDNSINDIQVLIDANITQVI